MHIKSVSRVKRLHFFMLLLVAGSLVNTIQFQAIDKNALILWEAVHRWDKETAPEYTVERRYGMFFAVDEMAPEATLYVPSHKPPSPSRLPSFQHKAFGVAGIAKMEVRNYGVETFLSELVLDEYIVAETDSYIIAGVSTPIKELVFVTRGDTNVFIDVRLLGEKQQQELKK